MHVRHTTSAKPPPSGKGTRPPPIRAGGILLEADWPPGASGIPAGFVVLWVRSPQDAERLLRSLGAAAPATQATRTAHHLGMLRRAGLMGPPSSRGTD